MQTDVITGAFGYSGAAIARELCAKEGQPERFLICERIETCSFPHLPTRGLR